MSGSGYSITDTGNDGASTSNNDGAACHSGDPDVTFAPTIPTPSQGSCDGSDRQINVVLNNSSSNVAANFVVTYTVNSGSSQSLTSGTSVSASSNGALTVPAQADNAQIVISWYAENTTNNLREPITGTTSLSTITIDASGCSSGPTDISSTVSQSLGTCSSGNATSTLSVRNNSSATGYYYVQYKIDSGSYQNANTNLSVSAGATNTSLTQSVSSGSTITWRYIDSDTSNDFTGLSYTTLSASSTVSSCTTTFTTSTSAGSCSSGSSTPSITVTNTGNSTGYFDVQWSTDNSSWTTLQNGNAIASGSNETYSVSSAQTHGTTVYFQVRSGLSNPSSGSYTAATAVTVDCPIIDVSASQALGSCSGGAKTSTLTLANSNSANTTAYFLVEYSLDGGSNWTQKAANQSVAKNASATLTQSVADGTAIQWRYKSSTASGSFSGSYVTSSDMNSATVDCPTPQTVSSSQALGSCSGGSKTSTLTVSNTSGASAYVKIEYSLDGGSNWTTKSSNATVTNGSGSLFTQSVADGSAITWRVTSSDTSNNFTGLTPTTLSASATVDCPQPVTVSGSQALGSCSAGAKTSDFTDLLNIFLVS